MLTRRRTSHLWLERRPGSVLIAILSYGWRLLWGRGPSGPQFNEIVICRGTETNTDPEQRVERAAQVSPSVPEKHEFVEIALQMAFSEAVEDTFGPCFQVGEHAVDPVEDLVCLLAADDLRLVRVCRRIFVTEPAVGDDVCAGFHDLTNEPVQRLRRSVGNVLHPDPARLAVV